MVPVNTPPVIEILCELLAVPATVLVAGVLVNCTGCPGTRVAVLGTVIKLPLAAVALGVSVAEPYRSLTAIPVYTPDVFATVTSAGIKLLTIVPVVPVVLIVFHRPPLAVVTNAVIELGVINPFVVYVVETDPLPNV